MEYRKGDLCTFLLKFQVEKWSEYTHTSILKPTGSFYIPSDKIDDFYELYSKAVTHDDDLYVTEKHRDISPILIDIDFRFEKDEDVPLRKYSHAEVFELVKLYANIIREYIDIDEYNMYVMQKSCPVADKNAIKDGIHIVIPTIVTKPSVQLIIRKRILNKCKSIFSKIEGLINTYDDIIDEAVIERNNWQMYGSKKPNCERYKITKIYNVNQTKEECLFKEKEIDNDSFYTTLLSIRNKYDETSIKDEKKSEIENYENEVKQKRLAALNKKKMSANGILQNSQNFKKNTFENIEYVQNLVEILSPERANKFTDWIRVGWCLRNIDHRLLDAWISFSKKSPKFQDGECEKIWNYMKEDGLGIGTLHMWAKLDNLDKYKEIIKRDLNGLILKSRNETHHDVANVVHFMYKHDYVCVSIKHNQWYEFKNHRWISCDSGFSLRSKISTDVCKEYMNHASYWSQKGSVDDDETEQQRCAEIAKKLNGLALKLKQIAFKDNIMKECKDMFYVEKFEEKLDSHPGLIGFQNGVYDLDAYEFREGRPEDYVSYSTNINYIPYDESSKSVKDINSFFSRVFPKQHIKEYVMMLLSSFLNGAIREEKFHIWTGNGSNGKSKAIDLFDQAFGEYCCKLPITLLTQKRAASNAATAELARTKGKRFACLQEPSEDEKLNVGLMKELTGGDKIMARSLFKEPIEFKPQFKMILTCNNLPNVPSDDGGTWRRIRVVEFTSKFCENPDSQKENEFEADTDLPEKFSVWKEHFMSMLIEYYKMYLEKGLTEPDEVLHCTKEYQKNNDIFLEFVETEFERSEEEMITYNDVLSSYKLWCKDNNVQPVSTKKKEFIKAISRILGRHIALNKVDAWKGWRFKKSENECDDLLG